MREIVDRPTRSRAPAPRGQSSITSTDRAANAQAGEQISKVTDLAGNVTTYAYGQDGELIDAKTTTTGGSVTERVYDYDDATNRTKLTLKRTGQADAITTYKYNRVNQLCWTLTGTSTNGCNRVPSGATGYSYDANGNQLTGGPGGAFGYDSWNRTTTIGSTNLGYLSPTQGELISYGTTSYTNNALGLSGQVTGTAKTYYVRNPAGAVVAQRRYTGSTPVDTDYVTTDALGSTIGLINGTSTSPVRDYSYDPDGNATSTGSGATTDIRYAGGQALSAGLYHYGARYYNPGTARWTQPDPINQISSLTEANRYAYVGGDPINAVDPTGLACADPTGVLCRLSNTVDDIIHKTPGKAAKWGCISSGAKGFASKAFPALKVSPWVTGGCVVYGVVKGIESE